MGGDGVGEGEAGKGGHARVEGLDFGMVPVEEGEEGGLGASRTFDAAEAEVVTGALEVAEVPE